MGLTKPRAYQIYDIDYKQAVRVVTTSNITLSGSAPNIVDGVTLNLNDRVLVTGQSTGSQNGLYYVTTVGTGSTGTWARSVDGNETGEILAGMIVMVTEGTTYADTQWKLTTNDPITIGSTSLTFVLNVQANSISSGTSNVVVNSNANVTISSAGTANVFTVSSTGTVTSGTASVTGNITGGNISTDGIISATGNINTVGTLNINSTTGNYNVLNISGTALAPYGTPQTWKFFTNNIALGSSGSWISFPDSSTQTTAYPGTASTLSLTGNITGGNLISNAQVTASGNITGGNILTGGQISATGNVTVGNITATIGAFTTFTSAQGGNVTGTLIATSANAQFFNQTNGAGYITVAGYLSAVGNVTGGNILTAGIMSSTGNATHGNILTGGLVSATGNVTGGNLITAGQVSATANITGGNLLTVGQISATGTITTAAGTNSTGFAVGNGAVSNVGLGFFPTAGTRGDYAIRDYSSVFSTMYLDVGMGGSAGGEFQFRTGNTYNLSMRANSSGVYSSGIMSATGMVYGSELNSTNSQANEGGQINLALPSSGSTLSTSVIIDVYQNKVRFFEGGGTARGAYIDLTSCSAGAATNLLAGGGGGTPGGSNTYVQFNDGGTFGGNGQFTYDKVTNTLTAGIVSANNNGSGQNFKVGDDAWIGDINLADTMRVMGQQNAANAYIVFGNTDGTALGRAGSGPLTYGGEFSATGNITGGNLSGTSISGTLTTAAQTNITSVGTLGSLAVTANITGGNANISGRILVGSGTAAAPGITFSADIGQDTGFYWVSDGNIGITTNGTLRATVLDTGISVVGNVTGGNVLTGGLISATGTISSDGNVIAGTNSKAAQSSFITNSASTQYGALVMQKAGTERWLIGSDNSSGNGNIVIRYNSTTNYLTVTETGTVSVTGNVSAGGLVGTLYTNSIVNTGANGTGNIGSSTLYFNTAFVKATSAQYADLAEMYVADNSYEPGTVVEFGGKNEITITTTSHSTAVAGIISTNPSYLMNSTQAGEYVLPVALTGRVPCRVLGPVNKGDVLVSSAYPGVAQRIGINWQPGCVVGKAMEKIELSEVQVIEVAVGRL